MNKITAPSLLLVLLILSLITLYVGVVDNTEPERPPATNIGLPKGQQSDSTGDSPTNKEHPARARVEHSNQDRSSGERNDAAGILTVRVHRVHQGNQIGPVSGLTVLVGPTGGPLPWGTRRQVTDDNGEAVFDSLEAGAVTVLVSRTRDRRKQVEIEPGRTKTISIELPPGMVVSGSVVDAAGAPVEDAVIEASPALSVDIGAEAVARSDAAGWFSFEWYGRSCLVGARSPVYSASALQLAKSSNRSAEVRIVLDTPGGVVVGSVLSPAGDPVSGATVIVGKGKTVGIMPFPRGAPPLAARVLSDDTGRFRAIGIPEGKQPISARATGFAPLTKEIEVAPRGTTTVHLQLTEGVTLKGTVRAGGRPVAGAVVQLGDFDALGFQRARTLGDGSYELTGIPLGTCELEASHERFGVAWSRLFLKHSGITNCDVDLDRGTVLRGRIVDADSKPIPDVRIVVEGSGTTRGGTSDAKGEFAINNCPIGSDLTVFAMGLGSGLVKRTGVRPEAGRLELRVERAKRPSSYLLGRLLDSEGRPIPNATAHAFSHSTRMYHSPGQTGSDGVFQIGPIRPGTWTLRFSAPTHCDHAMPDIAVIANSKKNLGDIRMAPGGTAVIELPNEGRSGLRLQVTERSGAHACNVPVHDRPLRTGILPSGKYRLLVSGKEIAAASVPFEIQAGEESKVKVVPTRGQRQRIEFTLAGDIAPTATVTLEIWRDSQLVFRSYAERTTTDRRVVEVILTPGEFKFVATSGSLTGTTVATVGKSGPQLVGIVLR